MPWQDAEAMSSEEDVLTRPKRVFGQGRGFGRGREGGGGARDAR